MSLGQPETETLSRSSGVASKGVGRDAPPPRLQGEGMGAPFGCAPADPATSL